MNPRGAGLAVVSRLVRQTGLDAGVSFAALGRVWSVLGAVVTIGLVVRSFSPVLQGYYYGFLSLLILQQLFQTGLSFVVQQFASHEWAHLRMVGGSIVGEPSAISRLGSLIRLSHRSFLATSAVALIVLILAGHVLFGGRYDPGVSWIGPWYALCLATSLSVLILPMAAILDGTGNVALEQRAQLVGGVAGSVGGWVAILAGLGLYSAAVIVGLRSAVVALMLARPYRPFARLRFLAPGGRLIHWRDLWPLQWRLSLTWLTGILIFQSLVPVTFQLVGPIAAGQMGLLNQIFQAVISIGGVWLVSAQPRMGGLAAGRRFSEARRLTEVTAIRCSVTAALVGAAAVVSVFVIDWARPDVGARFGSPGLLVILVLAAIVMQPGAAMVAAVRFQKKEPFVRLGLVSAALSLIAMAAGAIWYGLPGVVIGFAGVIALLVTPWSIVIYRREMAREEALGSVSRAEWERIESAAVSLAGIPRVGDTP